MSRLDDLARAFLRYLYDDDHFRPHVADFLPSSYARALNPPAGEAELGQVLSWLRTNELVATSGGSAGALPARAGLTGSGLICAGYHGADVNAWSQEQASVVLAEPEAPEALVPQQATSERTLDTRPTFTGLARVARVALLTLPTVHARYEEDALVQITAEQLLHATREAEPDAQRIRDLAHSLRDQLNTGSVANTLGVVLLDGLDEAMQESRLT